MPRTSLKKAKTVDSVQLAKDAADDLFGQIATDFNQIQEGNGATIPDVVDKIREALIAEYVSQGGSRDAEGEDDGFAVEAGYLVGVQVGLRMRQGGA